MCIGLHRKFLTYFWHCYVGGSDFCLSTARGILCFLFPGYFNPYLSLIAGHGGSPCWHTACSLRTGPISEDAHVAARRILTQTPGRWVPPPAGRPRAGPSLPPALPGAGAAAPAEPPWPAAPRPGSALPLLGRAAAPPPSPEGNPAPPGCGSSPGAAPAPPGERSVCGAEGPTGWGGGARPGCSGSVRARVIWNPLERKEGSPV